MNRNYILRSNMRNTCLKETQMKMETQFYYILTVSSVLLTSIVKMDSCIISTLITSTVTFVRTQTLVTIIYIQECLRLSDTFITETIRVQKNTSELVTTFVNNRIVLISHSQSMKTSKSWIYIWLRLIHSIMTRNIRNTNRNT